MWCLKTPFLFECIYAYNCGIWVQYVVQSLWYPIWCAGYGKYWWIWYGLVPFQMKGGPYCVLVLIASNRVVLFFNGIHEEIPYGGDYKYCRFLYGHFLRVSIPPILNIRDGLEECKSNIFPIRKIVDQKLPYFTNIFHTLRTKLGIKDSEWHLVLKYRGCIHIYIQTKMVFLDIASLGTTYRYAVEIEEKFKKKRREFGSANPSQSKQGKGSPKPHNKGPSWDGRP